MLFFFMSELNDPDLDTYATANARSYGMISRISNHEHNENKGFHEPRAIMRIQYRLA
jgi:hypothetical protein